ncbi:MAG: ABC transporter ATP-binding protein [Planctomycetes bacterium]|nr:ABC transporter ATP-binding protein [Planctomycetota bacterium]
MVTETRTGDVRKPPLATAAETSDAIRVENLSVRFRIPQERVSSLKEFAIRRFRNRVSFREFWALQDVTLSVRRGETFGIVGRNGAGKSTLLKVIARVLRPTAGRVRVHGRIVPLLDIGAGFHPELTGRENVRFNATLLGRSPAEIDHAFADIVAFSELSGFMDAPLRTYSSGMAARLGFAVATAWKPDLLLVDETLAVGDEGFRAKCQARLEGFRRQGTTMVWVSHDRNQMVALCDRAVWLDGGRVKRIGPSAEVADAYANSKAGDEYEETRP